MRVWLTARERRRHLGHTFTSTSTRHARSIREKFILNGRHALRMGGNDIIHHIRTSVGQRRPLSDRPIVHSHFTFTIALSVYIALTSTDIRMLNNNPRHTNTKKIAVVRPGSLRVCYPKRINPSPNVVCVVVVGGGRASAKIRGKSLSSHALVLSDHNLPVN